jgi:hypothetical protein
VQIEDSAGISRSFERRAHLVFLRSVTYYAPMVYVAYFGSSLFSVELFLPKRLKIHPGGMVDISRGQARVSGRRPRTKPQELPRPERASEQD